MEALFENNIVFIFFFAIIGIFNYSDMKEYQRIAIIYITIYSLVFLRKITVILSLILTIVTLFCYLEIFTNDEMKLKILYKLHYKIIDCTYISIAQYKLFPFMLSLISLGNRFENIFQYSNILFQAVSLVIIIITINSVLRQKFIVSSFKEMYHVFSVMPIYDVDFNPKLKEASCILLSIEDKYYFTRKGYTFLSFDYILKILSEKAKNKTIFGKIRGIFRTGNKFSKHFFDAKRGYSTVPMQLIRSIGIKKGYESCKYRRKIFEIIYSRMFFNGMKKLYEDDYVYQREKFKDYLIYIYFHSVNTFLNGKRFEKFFKAFNPNYSDNKSFDIYSASNEGIFIACMGLSNRVGLINETTIDRYISKIENVHLDKENILQQVYALSKKTASDIYLV